METEILGYIYIIQSLCYGNRVKIGQTQNINRRKWDYYTCVPDDVKYNSYFAIISYGKFSEYKNPLISIEKTIHNHPWFKARRTNKRKEFFIGHDCIDDFVMNIENLLDVNGVSFKPIYKDEIFNRPKREKHEYKKEEEINNEINEDFQLRDYQEECIELMKKEKIGKFILPTGAGKTVIFLDYLKNQGGTNLVLVPFIELVNQTYEKAKSFGFEKIVKICNGERVIYGNKKSQNVLYISTYQSSDKKVYSLTNIEFDNIIYDETHYTVLSGQNENSMFQHVLKNGKGKKKFFFTATEKNIKMRLKKNVDITEFEEEDFDGEENDNREITMDNKEIYGETLYNMSLDQAIEKNIICDYNINIWIHRENNKMETVGNIIRKKIGNKILVFCGNKSTMKSLCEFLENHLNPEGNSDFYIDYADSDMNEKTRKKIINEFKENKGISVLVLCGLFKVGFDCPCIDTIIHYDKCNSTIDLIQKNGRCLRKFTGKIKGTIIFLTNIDNHDIDIVHYKKVLNGMCLYDQRIKGRMIEMREKRERGLYTPINMRYDFEGEDLYGIYNKYMDYISGYNNVLKKMKLLIEYRLKKGKWPRQREEIENIKIGDFWCSFKQRFLNPIKIGENQKYYTIEKEQIVKMLKDANLWEEALNTVNLEKEMTPIEKIQKTIEYRIETGKWPKSKQKYDDINIGSFFCNLKTLLIKPIKMNEKILHYVIEKDQIVKMLKDANLWEEALNTINLEKLKKMKEARKIAPIQKMQKTIEYRIETGKWPGDKEEYENIKIGSFLANLKRRFIRPIKLGKNPDLHETKRDQIVKMLKDANLWEELLNSIDVGEKETISPIERMQKTIEYRIKTGKWPIFKEEYENIKIGSFWSHFKNRFLKRIKLKKEGKPYDKKKKPYKKEKNQMISLLKNSNLWNEALKLVSI